MGGCILQWGEKAGSGAWECSGLHPKSAEAIDRERPAARLSQIQVRIDLSGGVAQIGLHQDVLLMHLRNVQIPSPG